jgi:hypothetical protein
MKAALIVRALLAVVAGAALIVLTAFADDLLRPDYKSHHVETIGSPSGEIEGVSMYDTQPVRSTIEVILLIAIPILSLGGSGAYLASLVPNRKVWVGGGASACGALIALMAIQAVMARRLGVGYAPGAITAAIWGVVSFAIGAGFSWVNAVWWPNKSLERTRER